MLLLDLFGNGNLQLGDTVRLAHQFRLQQHTEGLPCERLASKLDEIRHIPISFASHQGPRHSHRLAQIAITEKQCVVE